MFLIAGILVYLTSLRQSSSRVNLCAVAKDSSRADAGNLGAPLLEPHLRERFPVIGSSLANRKVTNPELEA